MEPGSKLSFIPKKSSREGFKTIYKEAGLGLLVKVSIFLFVVSVAGYGAAFLYQKSISREINDLTTSLDRAKSAFDPSLISQMENLMGSISFAKELLNNHIYPSGIFDALQTITHEKVRFTNFSFRDTQSATPSVAGEGRDLTIFLNGSAESYRVLAEQSKIFEESDLVKTFSFSGFQLQEGEIVFSLNLSLDPNILLRN